MSSVKFTLYVQCGSFVKAVTIDDLTPESNLHDAIAQRLYCPPQSITLSIPAVGLANGGIEHIPYPAPHSCFDYDERYDPILRTEVFTLRPERKKNLSSRIRRALMEMHALGQVVNTTTTFQNHTVAALFSSYLMVVKVLDPIVDILPAVSGLPHEASDIRTVHQAIQFVFEDSNNSCPVLRVRCNDSDVLQAFHQLPPALQRNRDVVLAVLGMGQSACRLIENDYTEDNFYKGDKEFVMHNIASGCLSTPGHMHHRFWDDFDVVLLILRTTLDRLVEGRYQKLKDQLKTNPVILTECLTRNGLVLKVCPPMVHSQREYVLMAIQSNGLALEYATDFRNDYDVVSTAVQNNGLALKFASPNLKSNPNLVGLAIAKDGASIEHASNWFRNDFQTAFNAVSQNAEAYGHLSNTLRKNKVLFHMAALKNPNTLRDAPHSFKDRFELLIPACVALYDETIEYSRGRSYEKIVVHALMHASERQRNNPELVLASVKAHPLSLEYASETLREAPHIVKTAMSNDPTAYTYATLTLQKTNKDLALMYAKTCDEQELRSAFRPEGVLVPWRADKDVAMTLLGRNVSNNAKDNIYVYADESLQNDPDVVEQAFIDPYDNGCLDRRYTQLWEDESFVLQLIEKHVHNPNCNLSHLLSFPCVKQNRDLVLKMLPRCNFHESYPDEDLASTLTLDKEMALQLLRFHPYVFDFTEDDGIWIPESHKTDPDVLGLMGRCAETAAPVMGV